MENKIDLSVKAILLVISLLLLHIAGKFLGGVGLLSDLFIVVGAYTVWNKVNSKTKRKELITTVSDMIDLEDISGIITSKIREVKSEVEAEGLMQSFNDMLNEDEKVLVEPLNASSEVAPLTEEEALEISTRPDNFKDGLGI